MRTFREIIEKVGTSELARTFGVDESHVRVMKARDSIPAEYWGALIEALPGLSFGQLRTLRSERFAKTGADPADVPRPTADTEAA